MIPREGVERLHQRYVIELCNLNAHVVVIPREGVESAKRTYEFVPVDYVIPREGVERSPSGGASSPRFLVL